MMIMMVMTLVMVMTMMMMMIKLPGCVENAKCLQLETKSTLTYHIAMLHFSVL